MYRLQFSGRWLADRRLRQVSHVGFSARIVISCPRGRYRLKRSWHLLSALCKDGRFRATIIWWSGVSCGHTISVRHVEAYTPK